MATRVRPPMIPFTVIPAPGETAVGAGAAPGVGMSPGGEGSGNPPTRGGNAPGNPPPCDTRGAKGSRRPRPPSEIAGGVGDGELGEAWLSDGVEGALAPGRVGPAAAGGRGAASGGDVTVRAAGASM
jgi:hypothetical protein